MGGMELISVGDSRQGSENFVVGPVNCDRSSFTK